ncbi:hypothetical protein IRZ83_19365, partial [Flavobacterium sp. JLP]|nr:hypothetical protein [Flavobacterium sp. JLP]
AVDPLSCNFPWNSPYAFSENKVINGIELEGLEFKNLQTDFGFKISLSLDNSNKITASIYTAITNNTHGFGFNIMNNSGRTSVNFAYVPKIDYNITANEQRINIGGNIAANPINFSINNPTNIVFKTSTKPDVPISNLGVGVGYNLFSRKLYFGLTNQKLETSLYQPDFELNGDTPFSKYNQNLVESSSADLKPQSNISFNLGGSFTTQVDGGIGNMKSMTVSNYPSQTNEEKNQLIKAHQKSEANKLSEQNQTPLEKKLNDNIKATTNTKSKVAPYVKKGFNAVQNLFKD